jgi:molecular chaperone GrpE
MDKNKQINTDDLLKQLEESKKLQDEYLNGWQRQKADFINYQKDSLRQAQEIVKYANEDLITDLLIVLDSFDISVNSLKNKELTENEKKIIQGLELIKTQLEDVLRKKGLKPIEALGEQFNPQFHEILEEIEEKGPPGVIIEEVIKGYELNGKVIRPSKVKVIKNN